MAKPGGSEKGLFLKAILLSFIIFFVGLFIFIALAIVTYARLPSFDEIQAYKPPQATKVVDKEGNIIYEFYEERRTDVSLNEVPPHVQSAFVSLEDRRFWSHWGLDVPGMVRALLANLIHFRIVQGASTITQQLARNMFLTHKRTIGRKFSEMILAVKIERCLTKEEILERYLNEIWFGSGVYGVSAAARYYFGKDVSELSVAEAALLAAIPKNPNRYSPFKNPEAAIARQRLVLKAMLKSGAITQEEYEAALDEKLVFSEKKEYTYGGIAPYYMEEVKKYISERYGEDFLYRGGGTVVVPMDIRLQEIANKAVDSVLREYDKVYKFKHTLSNYIYDPKNLSEPKYLQAALVAMDPNTGEVLAMVGGRNYFHSMYNRATQAYRQTGSSFKPFVYLAAAVAGYGTGHILYDAPIEVQDAGRVWTPSNYDHQYLGPITERRALALSRNLATVRLAMEVGPATVTEIAKKCGIKTKMEPYYSTALGAHSLTLLEMTNAYCTIADYGTKHDPLLVLEVYDANGNLLEKNEPVGERVVDSASCYLVISMMESVMNEGTGVRARTQYGFQRPAAGKTGTTSWYKDTWFIGFTPSLACGVWVGFDEPKTIVPGATGTAFALPVWSAFMREATKLYPSEQFITPPGVTWVSVCATSGMLPTPKCPNVRLEAFKSGTEPTETCPIHIPGGTQELLEQWEKKFQEGQMKPQGQ
ncbi:MAG: PBP1A family penicillin-binding protein [candidate division WOR-3 bacterium]